MRIFAVVDLANELDPSPGATARAAPRRDSDPDDNYEHRADLRAVWAVNKLFMHVYQRVHAHTSCPIPATGPALIACNHTAGLDPMTVQAVCPRNIVWIMTHEYYDLPSLKWLFKRSEQIRIERESNDSGAWREALRCLKKGRVVGVFPEGRIEKTPDLMPFQPGVAMLALRGGADFFPVYLDGMQRNRDMLTTYLTPQHPSVAWGRPLKVEPGKPDAAKLQAITDRVQARVAALKDAYPAPRRRGTPLLGVD